jgi:hypothetical protein
VNFSNDRLGSNPVIVVMSATRPLFLRKQTFVPDLAMSRSANRRHQACLFDHFVRAGEKRGRDVDAERPGGLEVDRQLEFRWLLDR